MSKELKLRLWDGKKMINLFDPAIAIRGTSLNVVFTNNFFDLWHSKEIIDRGEISEYKLIEYTGLKDKKSNEIFDGDILFDGEYNYVVSWNKKLASFSLDRKGWAFSHWFGESLNPEQVEIIGNIYETPEKLK